MKLHISSPGRKAAVALRLVGAMLVLLVALAQSTNARAALPIDVDVVPDARTDQSPVRVRLADVPVLQNDYNVKLRGDEDGTIISLSGVPLLELLTRAAVNTTDVQFVKIRFGTKDDSAMALIALNPSNVERPPMILGTGQVPNRGPFFTPAVVPGQPDITRPILETSFMPFSTKRGRLTLVPGAPGAKILSVNLRAAKRKSGEYVARTSVRGGAIGSVRTYTWFGYKSNGQPFVLGTTPTVVTRDATRGHSTHFISVVVRERTTGSTGVGGFSYKSRPKRK